MTIIPEKTTEFIRCTKCGKVHRVGSCEREKENSEDTFKKNVLERLDRIIYLLEVGLGQHGR